MSENRAGCEGKTLLQKNQKRFLLVLYGASIQMKQLKRSLKQHKTTCKAQATHIRKSAD